MSESLSAVIDATYNFAMFNYSKTYNITTISAFFQLNCSTVERAVLKMTGSRTYDRMVKLNLSHGSWNCAFFFRRGVRITSKQPSYHNSRNDKIEL